MGVTEKSLGGRAFLGSGSLSGGPHGSDGGESGSLLGDQRTRVAMDTAGGEEDGEEPRSGTAHEEEMALRQVGLGLWEGGGGGVGGGGGGVFVWVF